MTATRSRFRRYGLVIVTVIATVLQIAQPAQAGTGPDTDDWRDAVARIPATAYTRDARTYLREAVDRLHPYMDREKRIDLLDPVRADVDSRFLDGVRPATRLDGEIIADHLHHLVRYLKGQLDGRRLLPGASRRAHVDALVRLLTGSRLIADAAVQDLEVTMSPYGIPGRPRAPVAPPTMTGPGRAATGSSASNGDSVASVPELPAALPAAYRSLARARHAFAAADHKLLRAQPIAAADFLADAWRHGSGALTELGISYQGDHDADRATDLVELRLGASPLIKDTDGDGLTDYTEIYVLIGWTLPTRWDTDSDGILDGDEDLDGDGLSNLAEQNRGTSPTEPDSEHDGVADGAEVRRGTDPLVRDARGPPLIGDLLPLDLRPTATDTDGDGLDDLAEGEEETDPARPDTDGDGLSDGSEVNELGISPLKTDSDGDGLGDGYEDAHRGDQGLDPGRPDEQVSKWSYVRDFVVGFLAGEFAPRDSLAWLSGYLCSGALSFIPVVGWILGGIADLRDAIAGVIHDDWIGAGLSVLGLIPYVGDAIAIPGKAARFVARYVHRLSDVIRFVARWDKLSDSVKTLVIRAVLLGDYGRLTGAGFTDEAIRRLARGDRTELRRLAEAVQSGRHVSGPRVPFLNNARAGEDHLINVLLSGRTGTPQFRINTPGVPRPGSYRVIDFAEQTPGGIVAHEAKVGTSRYGTEVGQCEKDAHLIQTGQLAGVHWHFMPHNRFNSLGPSQELLACLLENGIAFTIHPPS